MIIYELLVQHAYDCAYGTYMTYGVSVSHDGKVIRVIEDISLEQEKVFALVERFNREALSPAHLDEAIENFLYDFEV